MRSISQLSQLMKSHGAIRLYAKKLVRNNNSKNQIYLGSDLSTLNVLPLKDIHTDSTAQSHAVRDRIKADIDFFWIDKYGKYKAPYVNLVLYPKYPEVRMSGFVRGCREAPSTVLNTSESGRALFLGITANGEVLGHATGSTDPVSRELHAIDSWESSGPLLHIPLDTVPITPKKRLLQELEHIYNRGWIPSSKLDSDGIPMPYSALNGGGYTFEAQFGIKPNGFAEPDYLGWELKQYGVKEFGKYGPVSPVTLFTPEPDGGIYVDSGIDIFMSKFGYADKHGKPNRVNFGGAYSCGKTYTKTSINNELFHPETKLKLVLEGYNQENEEWSSNGCIALVSQRNEIAAKWSFAKILKHWNKKHQSACYVPSLKRKIGTAIEYKYGSKILLCEATDFNKFLKALNSGAIRYEPAIKIENVNSSNPSIKRRGQFRVDHRNLKSLYKDYEIFELAAGATN